MRGLFILGMFVFVVATLGACTSLRTTAPAPVTGVNPPDPFWTDVAPQPGTGVVQPAPAPTPPVPSRVSGRVNF